MGVISRSHEVTDMFYNFTAGAPISIIIFLNFIQLDFFYIHFFLVDLHSKNQCQMHSF